MRVYTHTQTHTRAHIYIQAYKNKTKKKKNAYIYRRTFDLESSLLLLLHLLLLFLSSIICFVQNTKESRMHTTTTTTTFPPHFLPHTQTDATTAINGAASCRLRSWTCPGQSHCDFLLIPRIKPKSCSGFSPRFPTSEEILNCCQFAHHTLSASSCGRAPIKPGAGIMEADDRQVTTVFTVQPSFHHRRSTNRVS